MVVGVLRVSKVRSGGGAYYLEVAAGGAGTGIEAAGRWLGTGPPELRLSGLVAAADLDAVLAGERPGSGQVLGTARHRVTVAGFDMTFSAPKSVSLLHALGDGEVAAAVTAGHESAVEAAMSYVERHALAVRRRQGVTGRPVPTTVDGVAAAAFVLMTRTCGAEMCRGTPYLPALIFIEPVSRLPPLVNESLAMLAG